MPDVKMYCITPFSSKYDGLNAQDSGCLQLLVQISSLSFLNFKFDIFLGLATQANVSHICSQMYGATIRLLSTAFAGGIGLEF